MTRKRGRNNARLDTGRVGADPREDHPSTLTSAGNLAEDLYALGEHQAARELDEDTLARRRRVLGEDHPSTQRSARNLAADTHALEGI